MAEAEDVILQAAEHVTTVARAVWRRHRPPEEPHGAALMDISRRLSLLIQASCGRGWALTPSDPPPKPYWLAERLRQRPPWERARHAEAFTDGVQIFLPRYLHLCGDEAKDRELLRLMALMLAARLARGSVGCCPAQPVARDLFWGMDGTMVEAFCLAEFPGLKAQIAAARRLALATRPSLDVLTPCERAVEQVVQQILEAPPGGVPATLLDPFPGPALPEAVAYWAERMVEQLPFRGAGLYRGMAPVPHWGRPRPDLLVPPAARGLKLERMGGPRRPTRVQRLPHRVEAREVAADAEDAREGPFVVPFGDPQQSVEDPSGLRRPSDQGEEPALEALAEELARLGQAPRVESDAAVREILETEGMRRARRASPEWSPQDVVGIAYPEWDYRVGAYRHGYCVLRETAASLGEAQWSARMLREHHTLIRDIRRRFEAIRPKRVRHRRQLAGDDLDLDAYVDDYAARRAGRTPTDRLYLADRAGRRDVAVVFLIDASSSTDAWASGGRRVLDIEKVATLVFCEALEALGDRFAVYAFSGRGARDVRVVRVKGFTDGYGEAVRIRIAGLHGETFTRLGTPIRHLTALLARRRTRLRLLFLLSDGKPNDEDEYEGAYGIEDTRQAVAEARLQGVTLFCLTVDRQGSIYLPQMFGPHGYTILWEIAQLTQRLPEIYRRVTTAHV